MVDTSSFFDYPHGDSDDPPPAAGGADAAFLAGLSEHDLAVLSSYSEVRRLRSGETLIEAGDSDPSLYIVTAGALEVRQPRRRGDEVVSRLPTGSVVGELTFFDGRPRSARVVASEPSEVIRLGRSAFESLAAMHPSLGRHILMDLGRVLSGRFRRMGDKSR